MIDHATRATPTYVEDALVALRAYQTVAHLRWFGGPHTPAGRKRAHDAEFILRQAQKRDPVLFRENTSLFERAHRWLKAELEKPLVSQ